MVNMSSDVMLIECCHCSVDDGLKDELSNRDVVGSKTRKEEAENNKGDILLLWGQKQRCPCLSHRWGGGGGGLQNCVTIA